MKRPIDGQLDHDTDSDTLHRLCDFLLDELTRERDAPRPNEERVEMLRGAFNTVIDVSRELRARGSLRSPTKFSPVDDPTVMGVAR